MSDASETLQSLRHAFHDAAIGLDSDLVFDEALMFDDIDGLDSVARVRLVMTVEQVFNVEISIRENSRLKTIGDMVRLIRSKRGESP